MINPIRFNFKGKKNSKGAKHEIMIGKYTFFPIYPSTHPGYWLSLQLIMVLFDKEVYKATWTNGKRFVLFLSFSLKFSTQKSQEFYLRLATGHRARITDKAINSPTQVLVLGKYFPQGKKKNNIIFIDQLNENLSRIKVFLSPRKYLKNLKWCFIQDNWIPNQNKTALNRLLRATTVLFDLCLFCYFTVDNWANVLDWLIDWLIGWSL